MSTLDPTTWSTAARQEGDRIATLLATLLLTRHLEPHLRFGLIAASLAAGSQIQEEQDDIPFHWNSLNGLIRDIKVQAMRNKDNKAVVDKWEKGMRRLLESAGETDFAFDHVKLELEEVEGLVLRKVKMSHLDSESNTYRLVDRFKSRIEVNGKQCRNGQSIWIAYIGERIKSIETKVGISLRDALNLSDESRARFQHILDAYFEELRTCLLVPSIEDDKAQCLAHWREIERAVQVFENLVDQRTTFLNTRAQPVAIFQVENFVARLTVWKPTRNQLALIPIVTHQNALAQRNVYNPVNRNDALQVPLL